MKYSNKITAAFVAALAVTTLNLMSMVRVAADEPVSAPASNGNPVMEVNRTGLDGYRLFSLTLAAENPPQTGLEEAKAPKHVFLGHLDGQVIQFWTTAQTADKAADKPAPGAPLTKADIEHLIPRVVQLRERDMSKLSIAADGIHGIIRIGIRSGYGTSSGPNLQYWGTLTINAKISNAKVAGTFTWSSTKAAPDHSDTGEVLYQCAGTLAGTIATTAELTSANALASGQQRLNWRGDGSGCVSGAKDPVTTDPRQIRLRWLSEDEMGMGWRMYTNALWIGGYNSFPLVIGNRVYVTYYRPTVDPSGTRDEAIGKGIDVAAKDRERVSVKEADEVIVCLDAATGVTLWKRVFIKDGWNLCGEAKFGPWMPPCIDDGKLFVEGTAGHVYCLDASTGKVLWRWQKPDAKLTKHNAPTVALQAGDGVVLNSSGMGLDAQTGAKLWDPSPLLSSGSRGNGTVGRLKWVHEGVSYFVSRDGCVRAKDGKECWKVPYPETVSSPSDPNKKLRISRSPWPVLKGDLLVIPGVSRYNPKNKEHGCAPLPTVCYRMYPDRIEKVWELSWTELPLGLDHAPVIDEGNVYFLTQTLEADSAQSGLVVCVDLKTGKVLSSSPAHFDANSNFSHLFAQHGLAYVSGRGGRLITLRPEGSSELRITDRESNIPPLPVTDGHLYPALLDGRLFKRTMQGFMSCYDLRKQE